MDDFYINYDSFKSDIRKDIRPIYAFWGDDFTLMSKCVNLIKKKTITSFPELCDIKHDVGAKISDIYSSVYQISMIPSDKCITVYNLNLSSITQKEDRKKLDEMLEYPPDNVVIILVFTDRDVPLKKIAKNRDLAKYYKLMQTITLSGGITVEINHPDARNMSAYLTSICTKRKCTISPKSLSYLMNKCGNDMGILENECIKLCDYVNSGDITLEHIDLVCCPTVESNIYDLSDYIFNRKLKESLILVSNLMYNGMDAKDIVSELGKNYINLLRLHQGIKARKLEDDMVSDFNFRSKPAAYPMFKLKPFVKFVNENKIYLSLSKVNKAYLDLMGGSRLDKQIIVEMLIENLIYILKHNKAI